MYALLSMNTMLKKVPECGSSFSPFELRNLTTMLFYHFCALHAKGVTVD